MMRIISIFILVIIQFGVKTDTNKDPKIDAPSSYELDDNPSIVGSFFVMEKTFHVTKEIYESLILHPQKEITLLGQNRIRVYETWKDIVGYKGFYRISTFGRVKSVYRIIMRSNGRKQTFKEKVLALSKLHGNGPGYYFVVGLCINGKSKHYQVHRLVAIAFLPKTIKNRTQVNHINKIKHDNFYLNLEWCSNRENISYGLLGQRKKTSKYIGVHFDKRWKKWIAYLYIGNTCHRLGAYDAEELAAIAYTKELKRRHLLNKYAV